MSNVLLYLCSFKAAVLGQCKWGVSATRPSGLKVARGSEMEGPSDLSSFVNGEFRWLVHSCTLM